MNSRKKPLISQLKIHGKGHIFFVLLGCLSCIGIVLIMLYVNCILFPDNGPCGDNGQPNPVWSNDNKGYAVIITNCEERYYGVWTIGDNDTKTMLINKRKIGNKLIRVDRIYYMKTAGYVLIKISLLGLSTYYYEAVNLSGTCRAIGKGGLDEFAIIPSPKGNQFASLDGILYQTYNKDRIIKINLLDANTIDTIYKYQVSVNYGSLNWYWKSDSCFVLRSYGENAIWLFTNGQIIKDTINRNENCVHLETSSDPVCPDKKLRLFYSESSTNNVSMDTDSTIYCSFQ